MNENIAQRLQAWKVSCGWNDWHVRSVQLLVLFMARSRSKAGKKRGKKVVLGKGKMKGNKAIDKKKNSKKMKKERNKLFKSEVAKMAVARFPKLAKIAKSKDGVELTLREKAELRLKEARFRMINESLYKMTGEEADNMFKSDPESFRVYQECYLNQTRKWPVNPVNIIMEKIRKRSNKPIVADFGCGSAILAKKLKNEVHSFDFIAANEHVTVCNVAKVPLSDASVDIAVFCLSLMGTNWAKYLGEANRILKAGGLLLIADISSRFAKIDRFEAALEKLGFEVTNKDLTHQLFIFFDCKKVSTWDGKCLPGMQLKPCLYKRR